MTAPVATSPAHEDVLACQLCGHGGRATLFRDGPFVVVRCAACGLVYVTPRLAGEALRAVYGEDYWRSASPKTRGYADYASDAALYLKTFRRRFRLLRRFLPDRPLRVLDVGCAAGYFLRVCRELGHDPWGVELSPAIGGLAQAALGADRVWLGDLDGAVAARPDAYTPHGFDVVTLWDVVEHVPDPQALLRTARRMLRPGGRLVLETQNVRSAFARLLGRRWQHFKHEEHLYHFDPATVRTLLVQAGFAVEHVTPRFGGKYVSFGFIAERAARLGRVAGVLLAPLRLARSANVYLNFFDEMIVVARPAREE